VLGFAAFSWTELIPGSTPVGLNIHIQILLIYNKIKNIIHMKSTYKGTSKGIVKLFEVKK
jgi:hypothetical protein